MSDSHVDTGEETVEKDNSQLEETTLDGEKEKKDIVETLIDGFKYLLDFYNKKGVEKKDF